MFGFGKKDKSVPVRDIIYIAKEAKYKALQDLLQNDKTCKVLCWFEATRRELHAYLPVDRKPEVLLASQYFYSPGTNFVFAEHYPLKQAEQELYKILAIEKAVVYSALQEPLFTSFGGEKIIQMMLQMGMKEDESIEHNMISKAIENAQEKIEKKVLVEQRTTSPEEWLLMNLSQSDMQ